MRLVDAGCRGLGVRRSHRAMLTACSRDYPDVPGMGRDGYRWGSGKHPRQPTVLVLESTAGNVAQMTHNSEAPGACRTGYGSAAGICRRSR